MKLSDLLKEIGDDNVSLQNLDTCATDLKYSEKKGTTITFGTEMRFDLKGTKRLGFVVWLDRDAVKKAMGN